MADPKNFREVAIDLEAFKREVGPQFAHLNRMVHWILTAVIGAAASGGLLIYTLASDLKANVAVLTEKVTVLSERMKTLEQNSVQASASTRQITETLARIEGRIIGDSGPFAPLVLTQNEEQIAREILGVKGPIKGPPGFSIGDPVPVDILKSVPEALENKLPKFSGAKYLFNNGYAIIAGAGNRVIAIIAPT